MKTLFEQWEYARDNFQHYAIKATYDSGDYHRRTVTYEERQYNVDMANIWDRVIKDIRLKINTQYNV